MAKYTISSDYGSVFGMDVHARSVTVKGFDWETGEERGKRFVDCPTAAEIAEWMRSNFTGPHYAAYESGCTGFRLCKDLRELGVACDVLAVTTIARSGDDKKRKTDKRDASRLLSELIAPKKSYSVVWVPDAECEAVRDLARARVDAVGAVKRSKQQTTSMLLRHGYVWHEKTESGKSFKNTWTKDHERWMSKIEFEDHVDREVLDFYLNCVRENADRAARLASRCAEISEMPRWKPYVDALTLIKGVDVQGALLLAAEFGDFHRFRNGRSVSSWLGTVPSEDSSGQRVVRGRITKAGNSHARTVLIEGLRTIGSQNTKMKLPRPGQDVSPEVQAHCHAATRRLQKRYGHLVEDNGLSPNKAAVAIANEAVRWVWAIGCMVQDEQTA